MGHAHSVMSPENTWTGRKMVHDSRLPHAAGTSCPRGRLVGQAVPAPWSRLRPSGPLSGGYSAYRDIVCLHNVAESDNAPLRTSKGVSMLKWGRGPQTLPKSDRAAETQGSTGRLANSAIEKVRLSRRYVIDLVRCRKRSDGPRDP